MAAYGTLGVLEERRVDRAGGVVEGQEDDPATGADRRGLGGDLDPGDQQLGLAAPGEQVAAADHAERVEERPVGVDDVPAHVEAEDLELGLHPLLGGHLRQPGDLALARLVAQRQGQLDRVDRRRRCGGPGLGGRPGPDTRRRRAGAARGRRRCRGPAGRSCCGRPRRRPWPGPPTRSGCPSATSGRSARGCPATSSRPARPSARSGRARRPGAAGRAGSPGRVGDLVPPAPMP